MERRSSQPQTETHSAQEQDREAPCEHCKNSLGQAALGGETMRKLPDDPKPEQEQTIDLEHRRVKYERPVGEDALDSVPILQIAGRTVSNGITFVQGRVPIKPIRIRTGRNRKRRPKPTF